MHSRTVIKSDVSVSSVHGTKRKNMTSTLTLVLALEVAFSKHTQWTCHFRGLLAAEIIDLRVHFLQRFRIFMYRSLFLCNNSDQTWFSNAFTFARCTSLSCPHGILSPGTRYHVVSWPRGHTLLRGRMSPPPRLILSSGTRYRRHGILSLGTLYPWVKCSPPPAPPPPLKFISYLFFFYNFYSATYFIALKMIFLCKIYYEWTK